MNETITRIAEATNVPAQQIAAWINNDESYDVDAIDTQIRANLQDGDEHPLNTLYNRGILTADEVAELSE